MYTEEVEVSRKRLVAGVLRFQREIFPKKQDRYQNLVRKGQKPHALFITCADSRVDPELITQSGPGEIFVCRNIGNIVPSYGEFTGAISSIIEYAVAALRVCNVIICGHTDCGAMKGLLDTKSVAGLPAVKSWLRHGDAALSVVTKRDVGPNRDYLDALVEENVLLQLHHLRTHPVIAAGLEEKSLALGGWVYDISHGAVRIYDREHRRFVPAAIEHPADLRATGT